MAKFIKTKEWAENRVANTKAAIDGTKTAIANATHPNEIEAQESFLRSLERDLIDDQSVLDAF